jgi:predicted DNA binding protein
MQWNFVEQSIPYIVSITTTNPVDVVEEHQSDSQDINLLRLAYISGYFESPRRLSLTELGQRAGLSSNSVNRRLRRIIAELVGERIDP